MKKIYIFPLLCVLLMGFSLSAQINFSESSQKIDESYNFEKLLEQYENNLLLDNDIPPGWEFTQTGSPHIISLFPSASPDFCGIPLQTGDYIGLFYVDTDGQEKCGGCIKWVDTTSAIPVIGYGDDSFTPDIKEGFSYLEEFTWYAYLYSNNEEIHPIAVPDYDPSYASDNKFRGSSNFPGLSIIKETIEVNYDNNIIIPSGWSGLSSFTETETFPPLIANVMAPISDELIILQDMNKIYFPSQGINSMFLWTDAHGYKIKLSEEAVFPMPGCPSSEISIDLDATWNLLPVMSSCNVLISDLFASVMDDLIVIKDIGGSSIYWPEWGIQTLQVLEPGKAYYVAVSQNTSVEFGDCGSYKSHPEPVEYTFRNISPWNTPVETGSSHTFAFPADVISNLEPGDYIAAFNAEGICTGLSQIDQPQASVALTVYGDDMLTPEDDGMAEGEEVWFKIFKTAQGESLNVFVEFDGSYAQHNGVFADNGLSVVASLKESASGMSESNSTGFDIFPNPAGDHVNIIVGNVGTCQVKLQQMNGQLVMNEMFSGDARIDVSDLSRGVYFVEIIGQKSRSVSKLIIK